MQPEHLFKIPATITTRAQSGAIDSFGDPTFVESSTTCRCEIQARQRSEADDGVSDTAETTFEGWFPPGTVIAHADRITAGGLTYEVVGASWRATNPRTGREDFVHAYLKRTV